jgi:hypothetical protein
MRKPVFPRILGLLGLYSLIFVSIVSIQFGKKGSFSLQVGNLLAEGQYRLLEEGEAVPYPNASPITGETSLYYGGLEFRLLGSVDNPRSRAEDTLYLMDATGNSYSGSAEYLAVEENGLRFYLTGGTELFFSAPVDDTELRISGIFSEGLFSSLQFPYRPLKSSRIRDTGTGEFVIIADGRNYQFNRTGTEDRQVLVLQKGGLPISYGIVGEEKQFTLEDYFLTEAQDAGIYAEALLQWVDRSYALWGRIIPTRNDEDLVVAYAGESLQRGIPRTAVIPPAFLNGNRRTYESSVYLGGMTAAQRGFVAAEREQLARITRSINENSVDFLLESHVLTFLALRNQGDLLDRGIALILALDAPTLDQAPGVLEALVDLRGLRPELFPVDQDADSALPFEALAGQMPLLLSPYLRRLPVTEAESLVLVVQDGRADMGWNLRLGKALADWGGDWAAIGRSMVLSMLSLGDGEGRVPAILLVDEQAETFSPGPGGDYISAGRLYRLLDMGDYRPHALAFNPASLGLWAWTASPAVQVTQTGQVLDIGVNFPQGESHYMLIRGVGPFYRLQFYDMDWRSDPQFERYDSSGWAYSAGNQILVLKMKHRTTDEHIRIFY